MTRYLALVVCAVAGCFPGASDHPPGADVAPADRFEAAAAYDSARSRMVMFGGIRGDRIQGATWAWVDDEWRVIAEDGPSPRTAAAMAYDAARDRIVMFGGRPEGSIDTCAETWELDDDTWTKIDVDGPACRYRHTMTYDAKGQRVLLFGGRRVDGCVDGSCQETWAYDGAWTLLTN